MVHRVGQRKAVRVFKFSMENSIEMHMNNLQAAKSALGSGTTRKLTPYERKKARITGLKDLFQVHTKLDSKWDGIYDDEKHDNDGGDPTLGGFIVDDDCFDY